MTDAQQAPGPPGAGCPGRRHLEPGFFVDAYHPAVQAFVDGHAGPYDGRTPRERAARLFVAVRDSLRYNPWAPEITREAFRASAVAGRDRATGGTCFDKATLLAACARTVGIPSRLHFVDVRNHAGIGALGEVLRSDVLLYHGFTELWLGDRWVAATPAFNRELCDLLDIDTPDFDGVRDALLPTHDRAGEPLIEHLADHGTFDDLPFEQMVAAWQQQYVSR